MKKLMTVQVPEHLAEHARRRAATLSGSVSQFVRVLLIADLETHPQLGDQPAEIVSTRRLARIRKGGSK